MTDRINSLTIALENDIRDDDIESLISALYHFKCVIHVGKNVTDSSLYTAEQRAKFEMRGKILEVLIDNLSYDNK